METKVTKTGFGESTQVAGFEVKNEKTKTTSLEQEMLAAWHKSDSLDQCIYVARNFAQKEKSIVKEIIQLQSECLEQCAKVFDPNSPIGIQIRLTLEKSKSL